MTPLVQAVTNILSVGTIVGDFLVLFLFFVLLSPASESGWGKKLAAFFDRYAIVFSFLIAAGGVVGSLFYSEYAHFAPCELCWIQRALLYAQALILFFALFARTERHRKRFNEIVRKFCLALSGVGVPVGIYHEYLQLGGGTIVPCSATGPSCQFVYFIQFGYVTIPMMSLTAFALILLFMLFKKPAEKDPAA